MMRALLIINLIALLAGVCALGYTLFASGGGPARINDMYRYEVINKEKLAQYAAEKYPPEIALRIEASLGDWVQDLSNSAAQRSSWAVVAFALLNLVCLLMYGRRNHKDGQPVGASDGDKPSC